MKALAFAVLRGLNAAYFVVSSLYCVLSYSSFAYAQFIRPQLVGWLPDVIAIQHLSFWLTLVITAPTLVPIIRSGRTHQRAAAADLSRRQPRPRALAHDQPGARDGGSEHQDARAGDSLARPAIRAGDRRSHHGRTAVVCAHRSPAAVLRSPRRIDRVLAGVRRLGSLVHPPDRRCRAVVGGAGGSCGHFARHALTGVCADLLDCGGGIVAGVADQAGAGGVLGARGALGRRTRVCAATRRRTRTVVQARKSRGCSRCG